jgi:hypothetical protein
MQPAQSGRAQVLVETEVFRNVRSAIQSGQFPILVLGAPGSGKTTLLTTMYNEWMQAGRRAVYIRLREVARNEDLYLLVLRELTVESASSPLGASPVGGTSVIASSGRATLRSTVEIIRSLPFEPLLLFDGLDEMSDSSGVLQLVDLLSGSSVKVVMIEPAGKPGASGRGTSSIDLRAFIKDAARSLAASGQMALVPLDRVDEIHKYDRDLQQKAVQGLFLAEGDLAELPEIRLVIFLRSDLFKIYDIQEKNKLVSRSITISWTNRSCSVSSRIGFSAIAACIG